VQVEIGVFGLVSVETVVPIAGSVREILVNVGDIADEGQELAILESMKMDVPVESTGAGTVLEIAVTPPVAVEEGRLLPRIGG
jgi:acetyl-CoA carboxylase biotin carboxyl carrier protein